MSNEGLMLAIICCALLVFGTWLVSIRREPLAAVKEGHWLLPLLVSAMLIRVVLAATAKGHATDIGTFSAWAGHAALGLGSFYLPGYFADYPPGYIYVLWLVGKLRLLLGLDFGSPAFLVLLKFPAILADCLTVWVIYRLAGRQWKGTTALAFAALYAFNPAVLINSAVWGQVDSVLTLFILVGVLLLESHPARSALFFALALLVKPQALIFAPLPLLWFSIRIVRRQRYAAADLLLFTGTAIVTFCLAIFPFAIGNNPAWIISKYASTLASYPYASFNAFNLFALTGGNLVPTAERLLLLPYAAWGNIFIVLIVVFTALLAFMGKDSTRFCYLPLFLSAAVFVLSAKMHERYLFPAVALALVFYIVSRERWGLLLFAGFSVTQFLNVAAVLALSYRKIYAIPRLDPLLLTVSLGNVLLLLLLVWVGYRRYIRQSLSGSTSAASPEGLRPVEKKPECSINI